MKASTILNWAASQVGVTEYPPGSNSVIYNDWFYGQKVSGAAYPWCAAFINYGFNVNGMAALYYGGSRCAGCTTLMLYHKKRGEFVTGDYKPGDLALFNFYGGRASDGGPDADHIGIVESVRPDGAIITIEGNTSVTSDDNGGAVMRRERRGSIIGAIRPKYEQEDEEVTPEQFKTLFNEMRAELRDNDSSTYSEEARAWATASGLVIGGDTGPDGQPNFMWEDMMTREQLVTVLYRFAQLLGRA